MSAGPEKLDQITVQVLSSALRSICEEMGAALIRSSYSTNIKERRDCSTALFDAAGNMVAQAEHIPVHLGAMPDSVRAVLAEQPQPGDVFILNDPFRGGTHLPDITLVSAVADTDGIFAYAASRAHHADVGSAEPGSMPAASRRLQDEGVIIPPTRLMAAGRLQEDFLADLLERMRRPRERRGDLRAQLGAGALGQRRLLELVERQGKALVQAAMRESLDYAGRRMRAAIGALPDGIYQAQDFLERDRRDLTIAVTVTVSGESIKIDFTGTSPQEEGNLNCPMSVTRSACYFVLRSATDPDIPPNSGALAPIHIEAPARCLVNAAPPAAVVAGNVETSQRIADTVALALSLVLPLPAQGQGTMNNMTLGSLTAQPGGPGSGEAGSGAGAGRAAIGAAAASFNYYETIGGGGGACPDHDGANGIHLGMTNTLNTPIEALEMAYPLRVESYELRPGSGGVGRHRGGDGVVRAIRLLAPARLSLLTDRRRHGPRGAAGGEPGKPGLNLVNGEEVPEKVTLSLKAGDVVRIETPGGGGYGKGATGAPGNSVV